MVRAYLLIWGKPLRSKAMERNNRQILIEMEGLRKNLS